MGLADSRAAGGDPVPVVRGGLISRRALFWRLGQAARVTKVSAPAGSGKTLLLRSWFAETGLAGRAAWVTVQREERDGQRFWLSVLDALRGTAAGSGLVQPLTAAPDLDTGAIVEGLLADLGGLEDRVWLVIDDVHELASAEALRQLELLILRAPPQLRFVLATRHDLRLGLHRLRLEGGLTEIREADLRFNLDEAKALFTTAGIELPDASLAQLHERTEGWAAGLRLAALSLTGHPDPAWFAEEFCGSERTVAEYLLAEVLDRQPEEVRLLLLRTSVAERVSGELADLLTGGSGGERTLQQLERAGAFVISLDARRSWFRYHQMFADLLRLELLRSEPARIPALHRLAAGWYEEHGYPVEAIRHAQAAQDWDLATRLLTDQWLGLVLDGQQATAHELLMAFPAGAVAADAQLTAVAAFDELTRGSLREAEFFLARAARRFEGSAGRVPAERSARVQMFLAIVRLALARRRGDLPAVAAEADRLLAAVEARDAVQPGLGEDLRALAMINLGMAETWAARAEDADRHLELGVALGRQIGRPYLELAGLAQGASVANFWLSYRLAERRSRQAIDLARRHGWGEDRAASVAYAALGVSLVGQGRPAEAERWLDRAGQTLRAESDPGAWLSLHYGRGLLELARGRYEQALNALKACERLAGTLVTPHALTTRARARIVQALTGLGETDLAEAILAGLDTCERQGAEMRTAVASLRLAQHDPRAARTALAPLLDGSFSEVHPVWVATAVLLEAVAQDALGDADAAWRALERALDVAEPDHMLYPFLIHRVPKLLDSHVRRPTAHAALINDIRSLLQEGDEGGGQPSHEQGGLGGIALPEVTLLDPLSQAETRVLHYLPTSLSVSEIADQLHLSVNTVRTHMRHLYDKLDVHQRHDAIERARALGLLASPREGNEREFPPLSLGLERLLSRTDRG
jgi:LuxR family transcriptional regulator, maltose regulon positive regulatory protein